MEDWDRLFSVNVRGVMLCYKHAARQMIAQGKGGRIIGASFTFDILLSRHIFLLILLWHWTLMIGVTRCMFDCREDRCSKLIRILCIEIRCERVNAKRGQVFQTSQVRKHVSLKYTSYSA